MQNSDHIVTLSSNQYDRGGHCWKYIGVHYKAKFVNATIGDLCPGCGHNGIDLSPSAFDKLAPLDDGCIQVTWNYE
ncbi:hypothetical protein ARMGADRAFT_1082722 [Armillaria gallica]|uniref:RlpA-like protein double-psi beta-barrel domain-containing protein n=1 Tax=Armillaria gallica TaxID=47427 RepID=A0A2H3DN06_ARMGA|nr:hypothetical protein ARMGADRAFT_1082722 [Armillaria gallica]